MNKSILATLNELISEYKIVDVEQVSMENGNASYNETLGCLINSGVPLVIFPIDDSVPIIIRNDTEWDSNDISDYLSNDAYLSDEQIQYLEEHWNELPRYTSK